MRGAKIFTGIVLSCAVIGSARADDLWDRASNRLTAALERELGLTRTATEVSRALGELDRERASLEYTATVLDHAGRESMRRLDAYRHTRGDREVKVRERARVLYKLARGGVARLALADLDPDAPTDTADRVVRARTLRVLVRHDLDELAIHRRAEARASSELVAAARELQAMSAATMIEAMQEHALVTAEQRLEPELTAALSKRRSIAASADALSLQASGVMLRVVEDNWKELRSLRGLDGAPTLARPVPGRIAGRFGAYEDPILRLPLQRNGVELAASTNEKVHAMAPGRVVVVSRLPGFEEIVVIDHGGGQYSLTARLWEVAVKEGAEVESGDVLAKVAPKAIDDGLGPTVYVELRHGEKPVDPAPYLRRAPVLQP
jgi:murein DD-endopeptidase MepM/ murein hydrolase activator NlpD